MKSTPKEILKKITRSATFQEYERAFQDSTGLPLTLTPLETWGLPQHGRKNENPFCALIATDPKACAGCLMNQKRLCEAGASNTVKCFAGFSETAVPVVVNGEAIGLLQTGQILQEAPSRKSFYALKEKLNRMGANLNPKEVEKAYFASPVVAPERYRATITMLRHFASHLELVANRLVMESETTEAPIIQRARTYIEENFSENITLKEIAAAVHTSTFYFCKIFRKGTGITFTEYLTRVRIEKAKSHLTNPHLRVSEIAFEVGFQSLSQFNRAFKGLTGRSPSDFRANPPRALVA
jgi:AraC-like DNA-binding protein